MDQAQKLGINIKIPGNTLNLLNNFPLIPLISRMFMVVSLSLIPQMEQILISRQ